MSTITVPSGARGEIKGGRTPTSKEFSCDNKFKIVSSRLDVVHAPVSGTVYTGTERDQYADVDTDFVAVDGGWKTKSTWYDCHISGAALKWTYASKVRGDFSGELYEIEDKPLSDYTLNIAPVVSGNTILFKDILDDLDFEFQAHATGLYLYKIIKGDKGPRTFTWRLDYSDDHSFNINTETHGHDNYGRAGRASDGPGKKTRRIDIQRNQKTTHSATGRTSVDYREHWNGKTFVRNAEGVLERSDDFIYPIWIDQDVTEDIADTADDGYEIVNGASTWYSTYIRNFIGHYGTNDYNGAWRFRTVNIPQGTTIENATLTIEADAAIGSGTTMTLNGVDVDDAPIFGTPSNVPSLLTKTTASASLALTTTGTKTVNVTSIVQEIVNRASWAANNDMAFVSVTPSPASGNHGMYTIDLSNASGEEAQLDVTFAAPESTSTLVNRWRFEEASGDRADSIGPMTLTVTGTDTSGTTAGILGNCLNAGSTFGFLQSGTTLALDCDGADNFTFTAWVNFNNAAGTREVFANYSNATETFLIVERVVGGQFKVTLRDTSDTDHEVTGTTVTAASTWYHVGVTYSRGGAVTLYVDGTAEGTPSTVGDERWKSAAPSPRFTVSSRPSGLDGMDGLLDEMSFDNVAFTAAEMLSDYNSGTPNDRVASYSADTTTGLIHRHQLGEASGDRMDSTGTLDFDVVVNEQGNGTGVLGDAWRSGSAENYIEVTTAPGINGISEATVALWVRFDNALGARQSIVRFNETAGAPFLFFLDRRESASGKFDLRFYDSANVNRQNLSTEDAVENTWFHLVGVYKRGSYQRLYVNGELGAAEKYASDLTLADISADPQCRIGSNHASSLPMDEGLIDELRMYNRALSAGEVAALYEAQAPEVSATASRRFSNDWFRSGG